MEEPQKSTESQPQKGANWGAIALLVLIPVALIVMVGTGFWTLSPASSPSVQKVTPSISPATSAAASDAGRD